MGGYPNTNDHFKFPTSVFLDSPKRKRQDLTPLSAISPAFGPSPPAAGPSTYYGRSETTPVKKLKLQRALPSPATVSKAAPLTSGFGLWTSPQKSTASNISALHPPIPLKRESDKLNRLPLGTIAPVHVALQAYGKSDGTDNTLPEGIEQDSDDEGSTRPCHPRMTDMPSLSSRLARLLVRQKSSLALFRSSTVHHQVNTSATSIFERNTSAHHTLQLTSVASHHEPTPIFRACEYGSAGRATDTSSMLVAFWIEDSSQNGAIHPNLIASALRQGESKPVVAMIWEPTYILPLAENVSIRLCIRYTLHVDDRRPGIPLVTR